MKHQDTAPAAGIRASEPQRATERATPPGRHGSSVVDAMTTRERVLTLGVLVLNLSLGAWLVNRADFSQVRSNQRDSQRVAAPASDPAPAQYANGEKLVRAERPKQ